MMTTQSSANSRCINCSLSIESRGLKSSSRVIVQSFGEVLSRRCTPLQTKVWQGSLWILISVLQPTFSSYSRSTYSALIRTLFIALSTALTSTESNISCNRRMRGREMSGTPCDFRIIAGWCGCDRSLSTPCESQLVSRSTSLMRRLKMTHERLVYDDCSIVAEVFRIPILP